ncbi:MAG: restriction endonuclease subunit S [Paludibacteraceae bacterium]|nr:restriction endonuclease subunit S [Paludibacteraceae bacterium]
MKEGWEIKKFTDVLWFQEGPGVRKHQYVSSGIKLLNVANLVEGKVDLSTSDRYISIEEAYGKYKHFLVDEGDLILASSGIQVEYIDKKLGFIKKEHLPLCMNTSTIRFKSLDTRRLDIVFFKYFLQSYNFKRQLFSLITGCAQLNFGPSHLKQMFLPIPPLDEQERIVGELDCLSGVIEKKKQQLKELDALAQSIFYEMFGNPVENDRGWEVKPLKEVAPNKVYKGEVPSVNDKFWLLNLDMISSNTGEIIQKCYFDLEEIGNSTIAFNADNVLYSKLRPYLNKVVVPNEIGYATSELIPLCPNGDVLDRTFFALLLRSSIFVEYISNKVAGAKMPRVSMGDFWIFPIILPPLSLQQQFAEKIEKIEKQKELVRKSIEEVEMLFNSRMEYYFN